MATAIGSSWTKLVEYASTDTYTVTYRLYAKYSATSITDNTHTIQLKWTTQKTSGGTGVYDNNSCTPKVTNISNGAPNSWTGTAFTIVQGSAVTETDRTTSSDIVVTHASNGTYSATWSWSLSHVYEGGSKSGTVQVTLPTIPRASTFTLSSNSISTAGTTTATITRADAGFTHKITTVYNNTTYYLLGTSSAASSTYPTASLSIPTALRTAMKSANAKSASLTLTLTTYSSSSVIGTATTSLTITAPTATVSMSASSVNCNANITWTLANTDTTACTYTVTRKYSSVTYTDQTKGTTTSYAGANANFQTIMSSSTSATVTTTVTTYVGTTTVGTATATYTVKVPTGTYYWNVANGTTTYQGGKQAGKSIAGLEHVTQTFTLSSQGTNNSSSVASWDVTCSRTDISLTVTKSSNTITVVTGTLPGSASNYTFTLTCTINDTRGTTKSVTTSAITATGYKKPTVSGSATRVNSSGQADSTGTYAKLNATATATTATMSSVTIKYGASTAASGTNSASINAYGGSFALTSAYSFTVTATDSFGQTTTITLQLPVASYEFNLYPGGGAAFGMVASANEVNIGHPVLRVNSTSANAQIISGSSTSDKANSINAWALSGRIYLVARGTTTGLKALVSVNNAGTSNDVITINQSNELTLPRVTFATNSFVANNAAQTPGIYYKPTNTSADSEVSYPGRIYYQTSVVGSEGRFAFREYSPTSDDPTKYVNFYEYYFLPAPNKDRTSSPNFEILTTKNLVTEAQGGTGQSSLDNVTVGVAKAVTVTNTESSGWTYVPSVAGTSGNQAVRTHAQGVYLYNSEGTTSAVGRVILRLGNEIASGTANNKRGELRLMSQNTGGITIMCENTTTASSSTSVLFRGKAGYVALEPVELYANGNGTTDTVTLSETSANFKYLDIYYFSVPTQSTSTKRYGHTRVAYANGKTVSLTNTVYWSNYLEITHRTIEISGTSITNASNEQAQFRMTSGSSPTRSSTSSLIYIIRVEGTR